MNPNVYLVVPFFLVGIVLSAYDYLYHTNLLNNYYTCFKKQGNNPKVYIPVLLFETTIWGYNIWRYRHGML